MKVVRWERDGGVGSIVLCNPPHNWLSRQFADDLADAVHQASESGIRALVIRTEGEHVSSGGAVFDWRPEEDRHQFRAFVADVNATYRAIEALPIPVIAAARGNVMGGGFELVLSARSGQSNATRQIGTQAMMGHERRLNESSAAVRPRSVPCSFRPVADQVRGAKQ